MRKVLALILKLFFNMVYPLTLTLQYLTLLTLVLSCTRETLTLTLQYLTLLTPVLNCTRETLTLTLQYLTV